MSWFTSHFIPFPNVELELLRLIGRQSHILSCELARSTHREVHQITAWLSILRRRDLVRSRGSSRATQFSLTSLGLQRLKFLTSQPEAQPGVQANARIVPARSAPTLRANAEPGCGRKNSASKVQMISGERDARRRSSKHHRGPGLPRSAATWSKCQLKPFGPPEAKLAGW